MRHRLNAALVWDRPLINRHVGDVGNVPIVSAFSNHALNIAIRNRSIELLLYSLLENNENEVGILLRCTYPYNVEWNTKGQTGQLLLDVKYYAVRSEQNQLIMIHNHPSSAGLSWRDIVNFLLDVRLQATVAVANRANRLFIMIKCNDFSIVKAKDSIKEIESRYNYVQDPQINRVKVRDIMLKLDDIGIDYITNDDWYTNKGVR